MGLIAQVRFVINPKLHAHCTLCVIAGEMDYRKGRSGRERRKAKKRALFFFILLISLGIVFNNLDGDDIEYTLRLRHEVGSRDTWFTRITAPVFQLAGPRVTK